MHIAMVCGSAGDTRCGVGDYAFELAQHLALDSTVDFYHDPQHGPAEPPYPRLTSLKMIPVSFSPLSALGLIGKLKAGDYDIVHVQYPSKGYGLSPVPGFLPQKLAGMESRSRVVVTLHEWSAVHPLRVMVMDQMLPHLDALVTTNEDEMEKLAHKVKHRLVMAMPVGNVLSSRAELEAVWLEAEGKPVPRMAEPAGPGGREPFSLFHYGLPTTKGKGLRRLLEALKLVREAHVPAVLYLGGEYLPSLKETGELLAAITEFELMDAVVKLGHIPRGHLAATAERHMLGVFPFDEGYSSKRSSLAALSNLDLPLVVGGESKEEHPFYAPEHNSAASLAILLIELLKGRLEHEWVQQVTAQRSYGRRFSFTNIAQSHLMLYKKVLDTA